MLDVGGIDEPTAQLTRLRQMTGRGDVARLVTETASDMQALEPEPRCLERQNEGGDTEDGQRDQNQSATLELRAGGLRLIVQIISFSRRHPVLGRPES
jgi:hypothetical protein